MLITRRDVLLAAASGFVVKPSQPTTRVTFEIPRGACDCHTHIFGDPSRFPFTPARTYTPEPASAAELRSLHKALGISRVVIVQPSVYGTDNACTLDAITQLGPAARGVAVIDDATPDSKLDEMHRRGMRGIRLNLETGGISDPAAARQRFQRAVERVRGRDWHIQIFTRLGVIEAISDLVQAAAVPVVFDHFGGAQAARGVDQPGFASLVNLVRSGKAYVKISAPYLSSTLAPDYADVVPLAKALIAANAAQVLWGTNWPHPDSAQVPGRKPTDIAPLRSVDDGQVLNLLPQWVPDAGTRRRILADNPARLYAF